MENKKHWYITEVEKEMMDKYPELSILIKRRVKLELEMRSFKESIGKEFGIFKLLDWINKLLKKIKE